MIRKRFKQYIKENSISVRCAAIELGCNPAYLSRVLNGNDHGLSGENLIDIENKMSTMMQENDEMIQRVYSGCYHLLSGVSLLSAKRILRSLLHDVEVTR